MSVPCPCDISNQSMQNCCEITKKIEFLEFSSEILCYYLCFFVTLQVIMVTNHLSKLITNKLGGAFTMLKRR